METTFTDFLKTLTEDELFMFKKYYINSYVNAKIQFDKWKKIQKQINDEMYRKFTGVSNGTV